jgi:hypothetical protein
MGNSKGSYSSTKENSFAAYEKLPPSARKALQEAAFDWAPQPIKTYWTKGRKGFKTGKDIAARVAEWDAKHIARDRKRVWKIEE